MSGAKPSVHPLNDLISKPARYQNLRPAALLRQIWQLGRNRLRDKNNHKLLTKIESHSGPLSVPLRRRADEYAREVLGHVRHARGLYVYAALRREFHEGWIPNSYYDDFVLPRICHVGRLAQGRHLTRRLLNSTAFPDLAYVVDGQLFDREFRPLAVAQAADIVFAGGNDAVLKRNASKRGQGIYRLRSKESAALNWQALPDGVIQAWVQPHEFFQQLVPDGGPTIRILTVLEPHGQAAAKAAYLRIARSHQQSVIPEDGLNIPVELSTGALRRNGYRSQNLAAITSHPDTGCVFEGLVVPEFHTLRQLTVGLHNGFGLTGVMGWDLTIDHAGQPQIYECNLYKAGIRFVEATIGPVFQGLGWESLWKTA
ncbi:MAG: sugar-transfer associated ATP-grasp domain-containing protein [Planctomycetota bacterium]